MMKPIIICIILSLSLNCMAQSTNYIQFPDSNAVWNQYHQSNCTGLTIYIDEDELFLSGDTTINGLNYHKLYNNYKSKEADCLSLNIYHSSQPIFNVRAGAIREDTAKRIFYYDYYNMQEYLLYNFNLTIGDTIPISYIHNDSAQKIFVSAIDSIFDGLNFRKRFILSDSIGNFCFNNYSSIIEGIGHTWGLLNGIDINTFEPGLKLLRCFIQDGAVRYQDSTALIFSSNPECSLLPVYELNLINEISIYPNPFSTETTFIISDTYNNSLLNIFDSYGKLIRVEQINNSIFNFNREDLSAGIYFYQILSKNGYITMGKLLIE